MLRAMKLLVTGAVLIQRRGGKKKRQSGVADVGKSAKKGKVEPTFTPASGTDGMLQCIFVEGECIPLWPQYLHRTTAENFIKVGTKESWVLQLMVASRKSVLRGYEEHSHGKKKKPFAKALVNSVCSELVHEFRRVVSKARTKRNGSPKEQAQGVLGIKMHDCEVIVSAHARQLHIRADEKAVTWIQSGLRRSVKVFLDVELRAMSHIASKIDDDQLFSVHNMRAGVRDKIIWMPETCRWMIKFKGELNADNVYCKNSGISVNIPVRLQDDEFRFAREKAF